MSDVPAAFPNDGFGQFKPDSGMSLRDYFAAQAFPAIYRDFWKDVDAHKYPVTDDWEYGLALDAYQIADAMLKAREVNCD